MARLWSSASDVGVVHALLIGAVSQRGLLRTRGRTSRRSPSFARRDVGRCLLMLSQGDRSVASDGSLKSNVVRNPQEVVVAHGPDSGQGHAAGVFRVETVLAQALFLDWGARGDL